MSLIKWSIVASCLLLQFFVAEMAHSFVITTSPRISTKQRQFQMSDLDYEYLPPNPDAAPAPPLEKLKSAYPPETPAGLRGEAVRSALRSTRCIAWQLLSKNILQVKGKGTMDFLSNKLSQSFDSSKSTFTQACLLNAKGRLVDLIAVATLSPNCAYMVGHDAQDLFDQLHPLIFPMDQVELKLVPTNMFSVASMDFEDVKVALEKYMVPLLDCKEFEFPSFDKECMHYELPSGGGTLTILPSVNLPNCAGRGYTLIFSGNSEIATKVWNNLIGEDNPKGPIEIGALEYETLRIQAGQPAYGKEMTAGLQKKKDEEKSAAAVAPPASPLELHLDKYVDMEKGCYLGQEGIASVVKNPRGPPRLLYSVEFDDELNIYQHQSGSSDKVPNLTTIPQEGQDLYVLGSNETIAVGKLTSVAEPGGTGDANIVAMALVRRADSILKQMRDSDIEMPSRITPEKDNNSGGMIQPPPMDPLDGLEVIVGGTYTVGTLKSIPSRRLPRGQNMFTIPHNNLDNEDMAGSVMGYRFVNDNVAEEEESVSSRKEEPNQVVLDKEDENELDKMQQAMEKAQAEAEAAAAEAKRKAEKMEMLRKRAEEAMARRKKKQQQKSNE